MAAAFALSFTGSGDADSAAILEKALADARGDVSAAAAAALIHLNPTRMSALLPILLHAKSPQVKPDLWWPSGSLETLGKEASDATVIDDWMRNGNVLTFSRMQKIGVREEDLPTIENALRDSDGRVRQKAALLLGLSDKRIGNVVSLLAGALSDRNFQVRWAAAWALGRFGPAARAALPAVERLLLDRRKAVRDAARGAIEAIRGG